MITSIPQNTGKALAVPSAATIIHDMLSGQFSPNELPDMAQLNGYREPVEALYWAYIKGGPEAAQQAWDDSIKLRPELANLFNANESYRPNFRIFHADEIDNLPPLTWLVEGEIPEGGFTVLFGPSGGGKTFVAMDYALQIAQEKPVVYVAGEGATGFADRKNAWCLHHNKKSGHLHFILEAVPLMDQLRVKDFIADIRYLSPKLVIFDTLARCMLGGDENSAKDMGLFIEACALIQRELKCAVLVIHHSGKNNSNERGSSALRGAADSMIELKNEDEIITLISAKAKDTKPFPTRHLRRETIQIDGDRSSCVLVPSARVVDITENALTPNQVRLLETLNMETFVKAGATAATLQKITDIALSTLYKILDKLMKAGYVSQHKKGDPHFITEAGKTALQGK